MTVSVAALGVASLIVTFWAELYVPAAGLNTGVAVAVAEPIVYVALETELSKKPLATAIAWIVVVELTGMAAVYSVDDFVGVVPFVV